MEKLIAGVESQREAVVTGRPADDRVGDPRRARAEDRRADQAGRRRGGRPAHLAQGPDAVGRRPDTPELGRPARLADDLRVDARARGRAERVRQGRASTTASPTRCCSAWAARRSGPRSSAARSATSRAGSSCTCSTRPTRARSSRPSRPSTSRRRCSSSRRSRAGRSRRCRSSSTSTRRVSEAVGEDDAGEPLRRDHRSGQRAGRAGRRARLPRRVPERPGHRRPLQRAVVLRARAGGADGRRRRAAARAARRWPSRRARTTTTRRTTRACGSGCALGELALQGRDKLTFVVDEPIESFGLWVEQLIAESLGKQGKGTLPVAGEPIGRRTSYGDDRVFVHLQQKDAPEAGFAARCRAGRPATRSSRSTWRARSTSAGSSSSPSSRRRSPGWVLEHQPVRPAERAGGQGQHQARCSTSDDVAGARGRRRRRAARARRQGRAAALRGDHGLRAAVGRVRRGDRRAAHERSATRPRRRRRSATARASCTRRASSTRAGRRPGVFLQLMHDGERGRRDPGRRLHVQQAEERAGHRRPADAARTRPARGAGSARGATRIGRCERLTQKIKEMHLMQIGFVGLGKMGGNMVRRIRRDSDHEVVGIEPRRGRRRRRSRDETGMRSAPSR